MGDSGINENVTKKIIVTHVEANAKLLKSSIDLPARKKCENFFYICT